MIYIKLLDVPGDKSKEIVKFACFAHAIESSNYKEALIDAYWICINAREVGIV